MNVRSFIDTAGRVNDPVFNLYPKMAQSAQRCVAPQSGATRTLFLLFHDDSCPLCGVTLQLVDFHRLLCRQGMVVYKNREEDMIYFDFNEEKPRQIFRS